MTKIDDSLLKFNINLYGEIKSISDTMSKCRVRIFYKGMNRNRTFITDDFAKQLIDSLPYVPIKGAYDDDEEDFGEHGKKNSDGKIYGIVPENPNFQWEKHKDEDGVERSYACCDVYLYTALYEEAAEVIQKGQSMELYRDTLEAEWKISDTDGMPYLSFTKACLLGLQILGEDVEPCFEGAAFFSLYNELKNLANDIKNFSKKEEDNMDKLKELIDSFKLSYSEEEAALWKAVNTDYNEEGDYTVDYFVCTMYDEYAICKKRKDDSYVRVYYSCDENDVLVIGEEVPVKIVDVTDSEYKALEAMKAAGSFSIAAEKLESIDTLTAEKEALAENYTEATAKIETLQAEVDAFSEKGTALNEETEAKFADFTAKLEALEAEKVRLTQENSDFKKENESLEAFKKSTEAEQKTAILDSFSEHLSDEQIDDFKTKMDEFTVTEFKKEICVTAYDSNPSMFAMNQEGYIFKNASVEKKKLTGAEKILSKYKMEGNK